MLELTELERSHLVETIIQVIREDEDAPIGGSSLNGDTLDALIECLEILGEPYETDD